MAFLKKGLSLILIFRVSLQSLVRLGAVELWGKADTSRNVFRSEGGFMLQGSAPREEGVLEVVVEQAADGGHVDVGKAWETTWEVGGVVVRPEETPELTVEDVLCLCPTSNTHSQHYVEALLNDQNYSFYQSSSLHYLMVSLSLIHSLTIALDAGSWWTCWKKNAWRRSTNLFRMLVTVK